MGNIKIQGNSYLTLLFNEKHMLCYIGTAIDEADNTLYSLYIADIYDSRRIAVQSTRLRGQRNEGLLYILDKAKGEIRYWNGALAAKRKRIHGDPMFIAEPFLVACYVP